jgi:hypothetical protein
MGPLGAENKMYFCLTSICQVWARFFP